MNFGVEHLYHDSEIPSNFTSLDAKEKLKTRQRNARDEKQLKRYNLTLQRAHSVMVKRQDWEKNNIQQDLHIIKLKSPSLQTGLKREAEAEKRQSQKLPEITASRHSLVRSNFSDKSSSSGASTSRATGNTSVRRNATFTAADLRYSAEIHATPPVETGPTSTVYMKKADVVTRNLHRLYKRQRERTSYIKQAVEIIRLNNQELLNEAKVYTRNNELHQSLQSFSHNKGISDKQSVSDIEENDVFDEETYKLNKLNTTENKLITTEYKSDDDGKVISDNVDIHFHGGVDSNNNTKMSNFHALDPTKEHDIFAPIHDKKQAFNTLQPTLDLKHNDTSLEHAFDLKQIDNSFNPTLDLKQPYPSLEPVSSVVVNPSESSSLFDDKNAKWTDIFRIPEMWKLFDGRKKVKQIEKPAPPALVTIRGKLRRTLLR